MDNPEQPTSMGNEVIGDRNSWNPRMEKEILQRNGIGQSSNSWTPVTPEKLMNERSNTVPVDKQLETEKWEDLIGMYTGLLQEKTAPSPNYGSRNLNPYQDHTYLKKNEAADWNTNLLAGPKKCSTRAPIPNQVESGSTSWTCMLGSQQTLRFTSNNLINDAHNRKDGFPVPYQPCYNPSSPPRSEQYTAVSTIIDSFPSALITPDDKRKHMDSQWVPQNVNFPVAETSTPAKDRHENRSMYNELLQSIGDSPSSAVSTTQKEYVPENRDEQGIDLSKTPQQKTPTKRKKHRPKVIREGKAKRTPKAKGPSNGASNEPRVKRKYVRKKGVNISETQGDDNKEKTPVVRVKRKYVRKKGIDNFRGQQKGGVDDVPTSAVETPAKSCKRQLNFELDHVAQDESHDIRKNQQAINVAVGPQDVSERSAIEIAQQNKSIGATMQSGNRLSTELNVPTIPLANARHHALNMLARSMALRNGEGMENTIFQAGMVSTNLERASEPSLLGTPQSFTSLNERRGIKRQSSEQMCRNINDMDAVLLYQKMLLGVARRAYDRNNLSSIFLENHKKTKMQSEFQEARQMHGIFRNGSPMHLLNSCTRRVDPSCKAMNVGGNVNSFQFQPPMAATHYIQKHEVFGVRHHAISSVPERSQNYHQGHQIGSTTATISWNPSKETSSYVVTAYPATLLEKRQGAKPSSYNQRLYGSDEMLQQHRYNLCKGYQQSSTIAKGQTRRQKAEVSVDDVTCKLEGLHIYDENKKEQRGLVLYRRDAAIVPFEPIKKRIPRPKVDLDPETDRLWTLLMGKEGSEDAATPDKNKEKWWENERRVFRGRVDSFIARMHLVQGDRKFSRWKGSVVDSVIGVFLTQNVSDHISSSAFMSLAAKFPPKSSTTNGTCCQDGACERPIEVAVPNDIIKCHEEPLSNQSSFVSSEPAENLTHQSPSTRSAASRISEEEVIISQDSLDSSTTQPIDEIRSSSGSNSEAEDATTGFEISKQSDPPVNLIKKEKPTMFKDHSCHDNCTTLLDEPNTSMHHVPKEPEDDIINLNCSSSSTSADSSIHLLQESLVSSSQYQMSMTPGPQKVCSLHLGEENTSSLPSSDSGMTKADHTSNVTYPQNEMSKFPTPSLGQYNLPSSHPAHQENFHPEPPVCSSHLSNTHHQQVTELLKEATGQSQTLEKGKSGAQKQDPAMFGGISIVDNQICFESTVTEANSKEQNYAYHESPTGADTNMSKTSKQTTDEEQNKVIDWDSLRKQVLSNGEKRERSKVAMDSLDYEALRCAHVSEISDAIRERGMNNLLADRIKNFLNRLVKDHEKVDLEWLRDAPPDKAKDYLLSIRGLGLKSVECVRLLTLHHLAFPVDTNVGRIAVRLGWVPLQTLPESLQLHLLEMYPVLESIQKYLWPRLCKMDQLTLYELHYQMITFGKVFCTKSKPNCNACPMRAECRHFASAFASARLALPSPEEKRMMTSDAPDPITHVVIRPMLLPPAENGLDESAKSFGRNCEPIIEEPTTPEPEAAELSIADIEDQYYEDSDEIPSIKLNMEEFTTNLQNIMQDSMELKEDVSKALVALNPTAAFIPTPKLKDVSRLRTEHQVYELPDSHRLLEGLDKREPDDPSPYLLAIWTPGETANSVLPPQRGCSAQESGKLCDRTTCFSCNNMKEANSQVVRGTILIPCRTAMRGSFPLNGTYFQVNEMFADHASSLNPIDVPRMWIWNLPRRIVYFGTSVTTIFKGLTTEGIQYCFWKGFVCVRGFDRETRTPRPLMARLHFPASRLVKTKNVGK